MGKNSGRRQSWVLSSLLAIGLLTGFQNALAQGGVHCPSGGQKFNNSGSVEGVNFQASGSTLTMTNTTSETVTVTWCAKGGSKFSNGGYNSGLRSTSLSPGQSASVSFGQDISHFVVYDVVPKPGNGGGGGGGGGGNGNGNGNGGGGGGGGGGNGNCNGGGGGGGGGGNGNGGGDNGGGGGGGFAEAAQPVEGEIPLTG